MFTFKIMAALSHVIRLIRAPGVFTSRDLHVQVWQSYQCAGAGWDGVWLDSDDLLIRDLLAFYIWLKYGLNWRMNVFGHPGSAWAKWLISWALCEALCDKSWGFKKWSLMWRWCKDIKRTLSLQWMRQEGIFMESFTTLNEHFVAYVISDETSTSVHLVFTSCANLNDTCIYRMTDWM